jgi:hypothetical protein
MIAQGLTIGALIALALIAFGVLMDRIDRRKRDKREALERAKLAQEKAQAVSMGRSQAGGRVDEKDYRDDAILAKRTKQ